MIGSRISLFKMDDTRWHSLANSTADLISRIPTDPILAAVRIVFDQTLVTLENYAEGRCKSPAEAFTEVLARSGTVVLPGAQRFDPALRAMSEELATVIEDPVNVNIYVSIRGESGLKWHVDPHDVLALQLAGRKQWQFSTGPGRWPYQRLTLEPARAIFVPTGLWHCTSTPDERLSVHASINLGRTAPGIASKAARVTQLPPAA